MTKRSPAPASKTKKGADSFAIEKTMPVSTIVSLLPNAEPLLAEYGLHCFHCAANQYETLVDGCMSHGFSDDDINDLVDDLNTLLKETPTRPQTLTLTLDAAKALKGVAESEGRLDQVLLVTLDERGGFCLEFAKESDPADITVTHREVPELRVAASVATLRRIGGATIDFRDGRFKLDLPEDKHACACGGKCDCE